MHTVPFCLIFIVPPFEGEFSLFASLEECYNYKINIFIVFRSPPRVELKFLLIKFYTGICLCHSYRVQCLRSFHRVYFSVWSLCEKFIVNKHSYTEIDPARVSCVLPVPDKNQILSFCERLSEEFLHFL